MPRRRDRLRCRRHRWPRWCCAYRGSDLERLDLAFFEEANTASYAGCWRYKTRQWRKVPGTNRRVPFRNDERNTITHFRPHLRIIEDPIWRDTQARLEQVRRFYTTTKDGKPKGRAVPGRATPYLFSSLLRCGVCAGKMVISGGSTDVYYRCEGYAKRGVCTNGLSVRESVVRACLLDELAQTSRHRPWHRLRAREARRAAGGARS